MVKSTTLREGQVSHSKNLGRQSKHAVSCTSLPECHCKAAQSRVPEQAKTKKCVNRDGTPMQNVIAGGFKVQVCGDFIWMFLCSAMASLLCHGTLPLRTVQASAWQETLPHMCSQDNVQIKMRSYNATYKQKWASLRHCVSKSKTQLAARRALSCSPRKMARLLCNSRTKQST